jgi:hypothetical protein
MQDVKDIIKNLQTLTTNNSSFKILKDFERVLDELDLYVFENWEDGELLAGPLVERYTVSCKFMWPYKKMPNPDGGARLLDYGCKVIYQKDKILIPRKIYDPDDIRPGTKKGKIDAFPVWIVGISIPKRLMEDMSQGVHRRMNQELADSLKYQQLQDYSSTPNEQGGGMASVAGGLEGLAPGGMPSEQ